MNTHLVANSFSVVQDLLLEQLKKPRREELEVLDVGLFGRSRSLRRTERRVGISENCSLGTDCKYFIVVKSSNAGTEYLRCFRLTNTQGLAEIGVDSVIRFTLSFWWFDPVVDDLGKTIQANHIHNIAKNARGTYWVKTF